jgi:hypothetical protein
MAFPVIAATIVSVEGAYINNHDGLIPAGTAAGDLLVALTATYTGDAGTFPVGWANIISQASGGSHRLEAWYKMAGVGEAAWVWTTPTTERSVTYTLRITGWHGVLPPEGAAVGGNSTTPDPPNLAPSWGLADTLWIAAFAEGAQAPSVYPYAANNNQQYSGGVGGAGALLAWCSAEIAAASENPGTFTIAVGTNWAAGTIAIPPILGGAGGPRVVQPPRLGWKTRVYGD